MFLNQSPWKVEGEEWEAKRNLGWVFVFVGWRQILVINPYGVTHIHTGTHTCTHTHIHGLNLIRYMPSWPVLLWWDLTFFPSLSPFSPAESYFRFVTCSLVRPYTCAHTWLHPHSPATQTAVWKTVWRWRLLWLLDSPHRRFWFRDRGGVRLFDFAGSQPENVFLDGFLAEAMLGELWPAHFTCQLLRLGWSSWSFFKFHTQKTTLLYSSPYLYQALQIWIHMHQCLRVGELTHLHLIFSDCSEWEREVWWVQPEVPLRCIQLLIAPKNHTLSKAQKVLQLVYTAMSRKNTCSVL